MNTLFLRRARKKELYQDIAVWSILLSVAVFLFWKCRYGIGNVDEAFYLTIPYRLLGGDALFADEWHMSQMAGVLTMPWVSILINLNGGTDGIILGMRYITTFLQYILAICVYYRLREHNWIGAVFSTVCFLLYIPFGIMALSYNSMGIMFLVLSALLLLPKNSIRKGSSFFAGLAYAAACLCCPYLIVVCFLYVAVAAGVLFAKKKANCQENHGVYSFQSLCFFVLGTVVAAALFMAFVFSRASLNEIITALSYILDDPEHPAISIGSKTWLYLQAIISATSISQYIYAIIAVLLAVCILDRNRRRHRPVYYCAAAVCTIVLMVNHYLECHYINKVMWAINILSVFIAILSEKKINRILFSLFWIPGILYSYCIHLSSNQMFFAISSAASVSAVGSIMMIVIGTQEMLENGMSKWYKRAAISCMTVILGIQLLTQMELRYSSVFWETGMEDQTVYIEEGIEAGLYVSEERAGEYASILENMESLQKYSPEKVLFLSPITGYYLMTDSKAASYSAWLSGVNEHTLARLDAYYELHSGELPDAVFADLAFQSIALRFAETYAYQTEYITGGMILYR